MHPPSSPRPNRLPLRLAALLFAALGGVALAIEGPEPPGPEAALRSCDAAWTTTGPNSAIAGYHDLVASESLPEELRSLVVLRLALAQMAAGENRAARDSLLRLTRLPLVPEHHRLRVYELLGSLRGIADPRDSRPAPIPRAAAAVSLFLSDRAAPGGNGTRDRPFRTAGEALARARELREQPGGLPEGPIEILLLGREFTPDAPIVFGKADRGTRRNPLVLASADPGNPCVITGGRPVARWENETDPVILARLAEGTGGRLLRASLAENDVPPLGALVFGGFGSPRELGDKGTFATFPVPELYHRGKLQTMARWPNDGDTRMQRRNFDDDRPLRWVGESDLWLHGYWGRSWADNHEKVRRIDPETRFIELEPPTSKFGFGYNRWHAVNALAEIDQPGEWHLDAGAGIIRYLPPSDFDPKQAVLSALPLLVQAQEMNHLTLRDLGFSNTRGDVLEFTGCEDLVVAGCDIRNASGIGIKVIGGWRHRIHSCAVNGMGRGGIHLVAGDRDTLTPSGSVVENCRVSHVSRIDRTYTPGVYLSGCGIIVRHCEFSDIPSSGIRCEGNDHRIEKSRFVRCVSESDDQGAIDTWGDPTYRGNVIRWNIFEDIRGAHGMVAGVRLDDAISGFSIVENVFLRSAVGEFGAVQIHGGKDNYVEGNWMIDCQTAISFTPWGDLEWRKRLGGGHEAITANVNRGLWKSARYRERYPALATLLDGPADRNFTSDNRAVGCAALYRIRPESTISWNDAALVIEPAPDSPDALRKLFPPWNIIPISNVGPP
jgi:hypothetical protein